LACSTCGEQDKCTQKLVENLKGRELRKSKKRLENKSDKDFKRIGC